MTKNKMSQCNVWNLIIKYARRKPDICKNKGWNEICCVIWLNWNIERNGLGGYLVVNWRK